MEKHLELASVHMKAQVKYVTAASNQSKNKKYPLWNQLKN